MRPANAIALRLAGATVVCALVYLLPLPGPRFYPLENVWRMENLADQPSMGWYAHAAIALLAGVAASVGLHPVLRRLPRDARRTPTMLRTAAFLAVVLSFTAACLLAWREFGSPS